MRSTHLIPTSAVLLSLALCACGNFAPGPAIISLSPASPVTGDDLVVTIDQDALDPEDKGLEYSYQWFLDGEPVSDSIGATLPADYTSRGDAWRVEVVANDGKADGPAMGAQATIGNTAPSATVSISPDEIYSSDDIVAAVDSSDPDGDTVSLDWSWTRDSQPTGHSTGTVPWADTSRYQLWQVTVVPSDGDLEGEPTVASVTVLNSAPTISNLELTPDPAYEDDVLRVSATFSDADNDSVSVVYSWYVDDALTLQGSATTMSGSYFDKHQDVYVEVLPSDGIEDGDLETTDTVGVLNSPPSMTGVSIEPSPLYEGSPATCVISGLDDTDGDAITTSFTWTVSGSSAGTGETLSGDAYERGDTIYCTVSTSDEDEAGDTRSSSTITVGNSLPVIDSVTLSPSPIYEGDVVSASIVGPTDDDGDTVTLTYAWYVNSSYVSTASTLTSSRFRKHDDVELLVTPNDGLDDGLTVSSGIIAVANTPAIFTDLVLSSDEATFGGTLTAYTSGWYDADGDSAGYLYAWYANGVVVSLSDTVDLSALRVGTQVHVEVTAFDGDDPGTTIASDVLTIQHALDVSAADVMLIGDAEEQIGRAVGLGDDVTGDRFGDVAIGAPYSNLGGADTGALYVVSRPVAGTIDVGSTAVAALYSDADSLAGWSLAFAGDIDGDGNDDLVVGAPGVGIFGADAGAFYMLPGPISGTGTLAAAGYELLATSAYEYAGSAVAGAGDLDGDGFNDVIVGAYGADAEAGAAYVAFGPITAGGILDMVDVKLGGEVIDDNAGCSVAGVGDTDGDGMDDLAIGAMGESSAGSSTGAAYLVLGPPTTSGSLSSLADAKFTGEHTWDYVGESVAGVGDTDGDGLDDFVISSRWEDSGGSSSGAVYLVLGGSTGTIGLSSADAKFLGAAVNELAGGAVAGIGDFDGDNLGDMLIGAEGGATGGSASGTVYMLQGPLTGTIDMDVSADLIVYGANVGDKLGLAVGGNGDVDGDGNPDIIMGAPYEDSAGSSSGAAYLFFGSSL